MSDMMCPILMHGWLSGKEDNRKDFSDAEEAYMLCKCGDFCTWYDTYKGSCRLIDALENISGAIGATIK